MIVVSSALSSEDDLPGLLCWAPPRSPAPVAATLVVPELRWRRSRYEASEGEIDLRMALVVRRMLERRLASAEPGSRARLVVISLGRR